MTAVIFVVLVIVALVLAGIDLIRTRGQSLTSWAALLIAIALLWQRYA